jgi:hypothetical protein
MAEGTLFPAAALIEYHSAFGFHKQIIPTQAYSDPGASLAALTVANWLSGTVNWEDMVTDLVTEFLPRFPTSVEFDRATPLYFSSPTADPLPLGTMGLGLVGTAGTPGWDKATMETIVVRDTAGDIMKIVLLDFASGNDFEKYVNAVTAGVDGIVGELTDETNGWRSRKGHRPQAFIS